jgi:hypothetical protein
MVGRGGARECVGGGATGTRGLVIDQSRPESTLVVEIRDSKKRPALGSRSDGCVVVYAMFGS